MPVPVLLVLLLGQVLPAAPTKQSLVAMWRSQQNEEKKYVKNIKFPPPQPPQKRTIHYIFCPIR